MNLIVQNLCKTIKGTPLLSDISFSAHSGQVVGITGPNGSGKTMLLRIIAGLVRPTSGAVMLDGQRVGVDIEFPTSVGILIETPTFLDSLTGFRNLQMLSSLGGGSSDEELRSLLQDVGLDCELQLPFKKYSLGMKQRLGIAAAIMGNPDLILLDEPSNALDSSGCERVEKVIERERDRGSLIVLVSHDTELVRNVSDKLYRLAEGRID